jgi:hypothetical protein
MFRLSVKVALKTAFDMAKGLKDIDNAVSRNAAVIELQENILAAQQAQAALIKRIDDLEKEVAGFEAWEREKDLRNPIRWFDQAGSRSCLSGVLQTIN